MASPKKVSSAKAFKKRSAPQELELPSGEVCLVKRPGMERLLAAGVIPDSLTPIAAESVERGKGEKKKSTDEQLSEVAKDPKQVAEVFRSFDRIAAMCVIEPECVWHERPVGDSDEFEIIPESERDEDTLYTDEIDSTDKMFIFQFVVGGTRDLERFREQFGESVASMDSIAVTEEPSK